MENITLTVIGCGDAFADGGRYQTCFYVQSPGCRFLIDCGATAYSGLKKNGISHEDIDLVMISHFHGDHFGGLPFLLLEAAETKRSRPLTIVSPPGCKEKIESLLELLYHGSEVLGKLKIDFKNYVSNKNMELEHLQILPVPVKHKEVTLPHGLRIQIGKKVISYSGDTAWTENLEKLAKNADLFICECNFYEREAKEHLTYKLLRENISLLGYKQILLTHFGKEMLQNLEKVDLDCAFDGKKIRL